MLPSTSATGTGTEAHHGARPNEISLKPLETVRDDADLRRARQHAVHLPPAGHESYGMVGTLTVT